MSSDKEILTTFEAAKYCHVHPGTIKNWIRNEHLKAFKTPGGHRRIYRRDLDKFLQDMDIPVTREEASRRRKVLVVVPDYKVRESIAKMLHRWGGAFEVSAVGNAFEGGELLAVFKPELVIIDPGITGLETDELCGHIKSSFPDEGVRVVVLGGDESAAEENLADAVLAMPLDIRELRKVIERVLEAKKGA